MRSASTAPRLPGRPQHRALERQRRRLARGVSNPCPPPPRERRPARTRSGFIPAELLSLDVPWESLVAGGSEPAALIRHAMLRGASTVTLACAPAARPHVRPPSPAGIIVGEGAAEHRWREVLGVLGLGLLAVGLSVLALFG